MHSDERPIGLFDSGVGGLTVLRAVRERFPYEHLIYLGDTARVPYGTKGADTVRAYATNVARLLIALDCKALVIACNTASAYAAEAVRAMSPVPVIDVIEPVAHHLRDHDPSSTIGILGTRGTVQSEAYVRALRALSPRQSVVQQACPLLVPLAEEGWLDGTITEAIVATYLAELAEEAQVSTLVLGCTHYPLLQPVIERVARRLHSSSTRVVNSAEIVASAVEAALDANGLRRRGDSLGSERILATDAPESLGAIARRFLGRAPPPIEHIDLSPSSENGSKP